MLPHITSLYIPEPGLDAGKRDNMAPEVGHAGHDKIPFCTYDEYDFNSNKILSTSLDTRLLPYPCMTTK